MAELNKEMFTIKGKNTQRMESISRPSLSFWQDAWRRLRKNRAAFVGLCIIVLYALLAIFAPMLSHYGFSTMDPNSIHAGPSSAHWLGCDATGRDLWVRTWMGARIIASYMKKHKDMKLKDLLEFTDYHEMLSESNYLAS